MSNSWRSWKKYMNKPILKLTALLFAASFIPVVWAADVVTSGLAKKFQECQTKSDHDGDVAAQRGLSLDACAIYLAVAARAFSNDNFERARPSFDKAFLQAEKMPESEQKEVLRQVSEILQHSFNSQNYDVYKYFAQHRLKLLRSQKGSTPTQIYNEVQTLAYSCSRNHRYKEALSLLKETLADLQKADPKSDSIGWCLYTLGRVSEDSGDTAAACAYYEKQIEFTRSTPEKRNYHRALESYTTFLIRKPLQKNLVQTASAFYDEILRTGDMDRVSLCNIAQGLSGVSFDLSSKYYRLAFDQQKRQAQTAMNSGYGRVACEWAELLHKNGKNDEAIAVLKEGLAFCRTSRWPDAMERDGKPMTELCQKYLKESHASGEAKKLQDELDAELASRERLHQDELERKINSAAVEPEVRVRAIMEKADRAFNQGNCSEGIGLIERAVAVYEANAHSPASAGIYNSLYNIRRRFAKCGREAECKPLLMRIVKARMVRGFNDPVTEGFQSNCGGTSWAFDELFGYFAPSESLDEALSMARASGNSSNVIFVLEQKKTRCRDADRIAVEEELERLRANYPDKEALISSMLETANTLVYFKRWDEAMRKCKGALAVYQSTSSGKARMPFSLSGSFYNLASSFRTAGRIADASELTLMAYRQSVQEDRDVFIKMNLRCIDELLNSYDSAHDTAAAAKLLAELLSITRSTLGPDNTFTRMWLMRISAFYLKNGDVGKAKKYYQELVASLFKPGLSVSKDNEEDLLVYLNALNHHGCLSESAKISGKLKELEQKHCGAK